MARVARVVAPGLPHHVTQRGNNRQDVFFTDDDRRFYLETLKTQSQRYGLEVWGYCLMTNHVHLVVTPKASDSLAKAIGRTNFQYTRYINRFHGRSGHLWQNRFFSCPTDGDHFLAALRYAESNPRRARIVRLPWRYRWSSAAAHCGQGDPPGLLDLTKWRKIMRPAHWRRLLVEAQEEQEVELIRKRTFTGRPLGSDRFIAKLETRLNRRLRANPVGRPAKKKKEKKVRATRTKRKTTARRRRK